MRREQRDIADGGIDIETRADGKRYIRGYAAVFFDPADKAGTEYRLRPDMVERIMPGAFDRAIAERQDVEARYNHDPNQLLGRVSTGTLELTVDQRGLRYAVPLDENDPDHQRVAAKVARGDVRGSSFSFAMRSRKPGTDGGLTVRNLTEVDLFDVGPVNKPAYTGTAVSVRSADEDEIARDMATLTESESIRLHRLHSLELQ